MQNGHVENHRTVSNSNKSAELDVNLDSGSMEDTVEFRLMMAYAQRKRPVKDAQTNCSVEGNITAPSRIKAEKDETQEKKKKKFGKRLWTIFRCIKPQTDETELPQHETEPPQHGATDQDEVKDRCFVLEDDVVKEEDEFGELAARVMGIVDEIEFSASDLEKDANEDDVERTVALLLRETGDKLAERFKEANLGVELFLNYSFFRAVIQTFLESIGFRSRDPNALGPQASPKTQIAVACEITSRLSALDTLASNRLLSYGALFLQEDYSAWAEQQGGYDAAFRDDEVD